MSTRRDLIREPLATDDPDLVPFRTATAATGVSFGEILQAIFDGQVLGGPDRRWDLRVSLSGLRALQERQREGAVSG